MSANTMDTARLTFLPEPGFFSRFVSRGSSRRSTRRTSGLSRNAITAPEMSGERTFRMLVTSLKKPGRSVKITTSRMLIKMTASAVTPHLK